jgi:DNA polymerase elongation subunit (family B)
VFQSGEIKARGIELRRRDTPAFVRETQQAMLEILAKASSVDELQNLLPEVQALVRKRLADLKSGRVPLEKLIVHQTLSRELDRYRSPSPAAIAARQLADTGKTLRPGQSVRLVFTLGSPDVHAWDLEEKIDPRTVDVTYYIKLLKRAEETISQFFDTENPSGEFALFAYKPNRLPVSGT